MTQREWTLRRKWAENIRCALHTEDVPACAGFVYPGEVFIEAMPDGRWLLVIANCQWIDAELAPLETRLFQWAQNEAIFEKPPMTNCEHLQIKRRGYQLVEDEGHFEHGQFVISNSDSEHYPETFGEVGDITYTCVACGEDVEPEEG